MTKHHARKKEVRSRMKETGRSFQAALRDLQKDDQAGSARAEEAQSLPNADRREDYIDAV